jgi:hypothetical protein
MYVGHGDVSCAAGQANDVPEVCQLRTTGISPANLEALAQLARIKQARA